MRKKKVLIAVIIVTFLAVFGLRAATGSGNVYQLLRTFNKILQQVEESYVQKIDPVELVRAAIRGMLSKLDPHSVYLTQKSYEELRIHTKGEYGGLGFTVGKREGILTVILPFEDTPAYRAGLQPADKIIKIGGIPTKDMELDEAVQKMRGTPGTQVTLTIEREGIDEPMDYTLTRAIIELKDVTYSGLIGSDIGYIRLVKFSEDASEEMRQALDSLIKQGASKFILDLRQNSGGLLLQAVGVSDNFFPPRKMIVSTKGRTSRANRDYYSTRPAKTEELPLIILVDGASASASEIVAGAVQDWDVGLIIGDTTFGKGSVQTVMPLEAGEAVKLTTARYYTPSGRCIDKPDTVKYLIRNPSLGQTFTTLGPLKRSFVSNGAIVPDIILEPREKLPSLFIEIYKNGLFMQYGSKYVREHPGLSKGFKVGTSMLEDFKSYIRTKGMEFTDSEFDSTKPFIQEHLELQIAEDKWGTKGKYEVLLSRDPWIKEATALLSRAISVQELFTVADIK